MIFHSTSLRLKANRQQFGWIILSFPVLEAEGIRIHPYGQTTARFIVNGKNRQKGVWFNVECNCRSWARGVVVGDELKIHAEIQLIRQS